MVEWTWEDTAEPTPEPATDAMPELAREAITHGAEAQEHAYTGQLTQDQRDRFLRLLEHCLNSGELLSANSGLLQALSQMRFAGEPTLAEFMAQAGKVQFEGSVGGAKGSPAPNAPIVLNAPEDESLGNLLHDLNTRDKLFADGVAWYDWENWERCYSLCSKGSSDSDREWRRGLERMRGRGPFAKFGHIPVVADVLALEQNHPNFAEPLHFIAQQLALCRRRGDRHFHLPPMLLTGPAGVGKTHFAQSLAKVLSTSRYQIDFASQSSGFTLAGLDRRWSSGSMGQIASAFLSADSIDPLFFLDEIDKAGVDSKSSPMGPLYGLLERESACRFRDEYLDMEVDASHIHWIAAANSVDPIPGPLLSRFQCFDIPTPTPAQMRHIAQGMFLKMLQGMQARQAEMPKSWMARLEHSSVRVAQRALSQALGRSALRAEIEGLQLLEFRNEDIPDLEGPKQRRPAFY